MFKADQTCCVRNCGKTRLDNVTLHSFPDSITQPERFRSWVWAIGGSLWALDDQKIYKYRRVCHSHFESRFHTWSKRLSANAVPTLCLLESENILHLFPNPVTDPDRFRTWLYAIGGDILALENDIIFKKYRVCHRHFESKYYTSSKRLSANAVPTLHFTGCEVVHPTTEINIEHVCDDILVGIENKKSDPKIMAPIEYVTGYILRKSKTVFKNCEECNSCLNDTAKSSEFIRLKDYSNTKNYLSYPSNDLVKYFSDIQDVISYILKYDSALNNIKSYLNILINIHCNFNFVTCAKHKNLISSVIQDQSCNFFLCNWCRDVNRILKGLRQDINAGDAMQQMAYEYWNKRNK